MQNAAGLELNTYFEMFKDNFRMVSKESGGKIAQAVMREGGYRGEGGRPLTFLDVPDARENTDPAGETPIMGHTLTDRWIYPQEWEFGDLITKRQIIEGMSDPTSSIYNAALKSMRRYEQRSVLVPAFFGEAKFGKRGEQTASFNATDYVIGGDGRRVNIQLGSTNDSSDIGVTEKKLKTIIEIFYALEVLLDDDETDNQVYMGLSSRQNTEIIDFAEINKDRFIEKPVIVNGLVQSWMGVRFIHSMMWPKVGNTRLLPAWIMSGMHLGSWVELDGFLQPNTNRKGNPHLYISQRKGAVRTDENKVLQVPCLEA